MSPRFNPRLTQLEIDVIERQAQRTGKDFSTIVDEAIQEYLAATDHGRKGITLYPTEEDLNDRKYTIRVETARQLRRLRDRKIAAQDVLRAAIAHLAKRSSSQ